MFFSVELALKMEQATHQLSSERPSVLLLNDDCLREIFKFLELQDFVNLAVTCSRLLCVAQQYKKYKSIMVDHGDSYTVQEFAKTLAVIGTNVASVNLFGTIHILKTIADNYTNSGIAELDSYYSGQIDGQLDSCISKPLHGILPFRNLKKLTVCYDLAEPDLSTDDWRNFFANNPKIENFVCYNHCSYQNEYIPLLQMLSELKNLRISKLSLYTEQFDHLSCLKSLRKLSIGGCNNYELLIDLIKKLNLVEFEFIMYCHEDTLAILKSSLQLEVLSIRTGGSDFRQFPESAIFPIMLKQLKLIGFHISRSHFLSIVKQLPLLEKFDIRFGKIICDNNEAEYFPNRPKDIQGSKIIARIAKELRAEKRKLKIYFFDLHSDYEHEQVCKYSDNLEIIIRHIRYADVALDLTDTIQLRIQ